MKAVFRIKQLHCKFCIIWFG